MVFKSFIQRVLSTKMRNKRKKWNVPGQHSMPTEVGDSPVEGMQSIGNSQLNRKWTRQDSDQ